MRKRKERKRKRDECGKEKKINLQIKKSNEEKQR
jgi:hypothetical protein